MASSTFPRVKVLQDKEGGPQGGHQGGHQGQEGHGDQQYEEEEEGYEDIADIEEDLDDMF